MEQVKEVTEGLQRLDYYLTNITNEQVGWGGAVLALAVGLPLPVPQLGRAGTC